MIELTMFPARDGDCLLLSYGLENQRHRILIDGGRAGTYSDVRPVLAALNPPGLDVLVVTHVDQDHVLGVLALLGDGARTPVRDVWFNGFDHLHDAQLETFGAQDGERLTSALIEQAIPWNHAFSGRAVEFGRTLETDLGGATITVLAPDRALLENLIPTWVKECKAHGMIPGIDPRPPAPEGFEAFGAVNVPTLAATPFTADSSKTNATSIAFLFEFEGARILFTGDGDDRRIVKSLRPLAEAEGGRLRLDALKVAHHGSAGNISTDLLDLITCQRYLFSTNGDRHAHPDPVAVSRIMVHGGDTKDLAFNYRSRAELWDVADLRGKFGYTVTAPEADRDGVLTVTIPAG